MKRAVCGYSRFNYRHQIRARLLEQGLNMSQFAKNIGVSPEIVSATILGKRHCPQVLDALKEYGIPEQYLFDPRDDSIG